MEKRVDLDAIGMICGSDKSSTFNSAHDYLRHYEFMFDDFRDQDINIIEIGVQKGPSLKAWKWYFPRATIVGVDIQSRCLKLREERVDVMIGSQADTDFMREVCAKYPPTIVIDDGSHLAEHNIVTFEAVFPLLAPGGLYVVEDMSCHFGTNAERWQTETRRDSPGYFMTLAMTRVAWERNDQAGGPPAEISATVDSVMALGGAVIIRKIDPQRDVDRALATVARYAESHPLDGGAQCRLANFIVEHGGPVEQALAAIEAALAEEVTPERLRVKALVSMAAGDGAAAASALAQADASGAPEGFLRKQVSTLRKQLQRDERRKARKLVES